MAQFSMKLTKDGMPKTFKILANNLSEENKYIQSVFLDGIRLETPFISYTQIMNGNKLVFEMGSEPNHEAFTNN